jgi:hypothetical protein
VTQPISAPPNHVDEVFPEASAPEETTHQAAEYIASARAAAPVIREVMVISNRYDYNHFYKMQAHVGVQNVPNLITEMVREGCKITDIQITFEVVEQR